MLTEIPAEQFATALETCAREALAEANINRPPIDAIHLANQLQLLITTNSKIQQRARYVKTNTGTKANRGTIVLGSEQRPERRHWAIAHEVGECLAHRVFSELGIFPSEIPPQAREQVANRLASCLLLPAHWFAADGRDLNWDLYDLKKRYQTASHEIIARRLLEMQPSIIITLFDQGKITWRRSNTIRRPPPLTSAETETWQIAFNDGQATEYSEVDLPAAINNIRCWPIHEPAWQREILRTELEEW